MNLHRFLRGFRARTAPHDDRDLNLRMRIFPDRAENFAPG